MKLTPLDIRHKEFKRGMRGYADVEVDEFLDEVADEYERLFKENIDLQDRVEALEEKVAGYQRIEETLQKTLVNAQASAEEQKQNASKQAQLILQDAELKARQMANEAYSERQSIEQSIAKLKSAQEDFRFNFRQMLEGYLRQLGEVKEPAEASGGSDLARHTEAIKEAIARESAAQLPAEAEPAPAVERSAEPAVERSGEPAVEQSGEPTAEQPERPEPAPPGFAESRRSEPEPPRPPVTEMPAATPSRGPGGVQAGAPRRSPTPETAQTEAEVTASQTPGVPAPGGHVEAASPTKEGTTDATPEVDKDEAKAPARRERILFGESDDLLADVDSGVNENEFKW